MDVFLSWSTERSDKLATMFNEWISNVLPTVKTYISTQQIGPGERWSENIGKGLETNFMGIFFMVEENVNSPWLNFEAGAISKNIDDSKVIPLLHKMKPEQVSGPMAQFQSKQIDKEDDIFNIVKQINNGIRDERRIDNEKLKTLFEKWYPDFVKAYDKFQVENPAPEKDEDKNSSALMDSGDQIGEILNIVRNLKRSDLKPEFIDRNYFKENIIKEKAERRFRQDIIETLSIYSEEKIIELLNQDGFRNALSSKVLSQYPNFSKSHINSIINDEAIKLIAEKKDIGPLLEKHTP